MSARDEIVEAVEAGYEMGDWAPDEQEIDAMLARHVAEVAASHELPDDADAKRQTLAELVAYRLTVIAEVTTMLRCTPRYDRDYPALLRAARRIEEWASP